MSRFSNYVINYFVYLVTADGLVDNSSLDWIS